jgi:hypothetical protein
MPYRMLEELQNRRKEKVAVFLTFENIVGLILVFFPVFLASSALPLLIRGPLCIGAAALGVALTLELEGLPLYEHLLWRVRGAVRLRAHGNLLAPHDLAGAVSHDLPERPLPLAGPVQAIDRAPPGVLAGVERHNGHVEGEHRADPATE